MACESYAAGPPGRVVEWFRTGLRQRIATALVPALICATLGWLLLVLGGRLVRSRSPEAGMLHRPTLPAASIVDAEGHPPAELELLPVEQALLGGGLLAVVASPFLLVYRLLRRGSRRESELLLRTDGLLLRSGDDETCVPWDEVEEVVHRPGVGKACGSVLLRRHDTTELLLDADYDGVDGAELAQRIRSIRGRALFGLLEPGPWPERSSDR